MRAATAVAALIAGFASSGYGRAELSDGVPERPVRIVVPYAPGGGLDITARLLAARLSERWAQSVVVDNRPGASGMVGTQIVVRAAPDGYTLAMVSSELVTAPLVYRQRLYDPLVDLTGVIQTVSQVFLLVVHPGLPVHSVRELIAYARARPEALSFASAGRGGVGHLSGELFKSMTGVRMTFIGYRGTGPALIDGLGGQVQVMFVNPLPALPHVKAGRLRALASTGARRIAVLPDLATVAQAGVAGFETTGWNGLVAPAATPRAVVQHLNHAAASVLRLDDVRARIQTDGVEPVGGAPQAFDALMAADHLRWSRIIARLALEPE